LVAPRAPFHTSAPLGGAPLKRLGEIFFRSFGQSKTRRTINFCVGEGLEVCPNCSVQLQCASDE